MEKIHAVSMDDMDYGELEALEDILGCIPASDEELKSVPKAKLIIACGYIAAKREDPNVTVDDIRKLPVGAIVFDDAEEDPTVPVDEN